MQSSEQINELAGALAKAQGLVENATKNAQNPHLKNKYADLAAVLDASRQPLTDCGLAIVTLPSGHMADAGVEFVSKLLHASGQWLSTTFVMPLQKRDAQGLGSALTYARRYALSAWLGIAQEDDDGNAASQPSREPLKVAPTKGGLHDALEAIAAAKSINELSEVGARIQKTLSEELRAELREPYNKRRDEISKGAA